MRAAFVLFDRLTALDFVAAFGPTPGRRCRRQEGGNADGLPVV